MKKNKKTTFITKLAAILLTLALVTSCIGDQSAGKRSGFVKDFSKDGSYNGCEGSSFVYQAPYDSCVSSCSSGFHLASVTELSELKKDLIENQDYLIDGVDAEIILERVNNSMNVCVPDVIKDERPTNAISINSNFCSCLNGKPDIINDCAATCAAKPVTTEPILYVSTILDPSIALNSKLGNLYNWCTIQLGEDTVTPKCSVIATDGTNTYDLPAVVTPNSNSFSVNVKQLSTDRTWLLKLQETQNSPYSQSKEFQIRRILPETTPGPILGALKLTPINQYSCMSYGAKVDTSGNIIRTSYTKYFYYFATNDIPAPMAPTTANSQSILVCHDEQLYPGNDSVDYPRLEMIPGHIYLFDRSDTRFVQQTENNNRLKINVLIQERLASEYGVDATIDLFKPFNYPNRPGASGILHGYMMVPFSDENTGKTYCPNSTHFTSGNSLFTILKDYIGNTEGIYIGEKEVEVIEDNGNFRSVYGTMFARESTLLNYGFYIENGIKIRIDSNTIHNKTVYYYWPTTTTADALLKGNRKLYTVRTVDTLQGQIPTAPATSERTTDKRIGCVPKS